MRFRSAARGAMAISRRRRDANHSTCWSFIRSQGGLPITASKPPVNSAASQSDHTPGNATCQFRKRSLATSPKASIRMGRSASDKSVCSPWATAI